MEIWLDFSVPWMLVSLVKFFIFAYNFPVDNQDAYNKAYSEDKSGFIWFKLLNYVL